MTERNSQSLYRKSSLLQIGTSHLRWEDECLIIDLDELAMPIPSRIRGQVRITVPAMVGQVYSLDESNNHEWHPIAPIATAEVKLENPSINWSGQAYIDSNSGDAPLEDVFSAWNWSRSVETHRTRVYYDIVPRNGPPVTLSLQFDETGHVAPIAPAPGVPLPKTSIWRIPRATRSETPSDARIIKTLEDTPFYSRSIIESRIDNTIVPAIHESLDLDRFNSPVVQLMLPFRMPRSCF